jgi:hypothetical protein
MRKVSTRETDKHFSIKNFHGFFIAIHSLARLIVYVRVLKMKYRPSGSGSGRGKDILFLNNETRHLQMSHITLKHMFFFADQEEESEEFFPSGRWCRGAGGEVVGEQIQHYAIHDMRKW